MATLGTEESGRCREVAVMGRGRASLIAQAYSAVIDHFWCL